MEQALAILSRLHSETLERGEESPTPFSCFYTTWVCLWHGDLAAASACVEEARQTAALLDDPAAHAIALAASALMHAFDGRATIARQEALESVRLFQELGWVTGSIWPLWALGIAELSIGHPASVDAALGPLAAGLMAMPGGDPVLGVFMPEEIEALVELGQLERAETLIEWLEQRGAELDRAWVLAAAGRCRGLLCASRGDVDEAIAALAGALAQHELCGMPLERARTLLVLGRVQAPRCDARTGQSHAHRSAHDVPEDRRAPVGRARSGRAGAYRAARRGARRADAHGIAGRAAGLVGLGQQGDRRAAFLTTKAVEANLTRVYRKLGIRSRGGLARALQATGDTPARSD